MQLGKVPVTVGNVDCGLYKCKAEYLYGIGLRIGRLSTDNPVLSANMFVLALLDRANMLRHVSGQKCANTDLILIKTMLLQNILLQSRIGSLS